MNWSPKGIPTIVIHHISPITKAVLASSHPNRMIQMKFKRKLPTPPENSIARPNGHRISQANFMH